MKGYDAKSCWMGWIGTEYQMFETEDEYVLWYRENIGD